MVKDKKLFHSLLDLVLKKKPETPVMINISALTCTAEVWFFEVVNGDELKKKECYRYRNGYWDKWDKDNRVTFASEKQVLEALRNAQLNRLQDMRETETAIGLYLEDYTDLFPQEIESFLDDLRMAVYDFEQEDEE